MIITSDFCDIIINITLQHPHSRERSKDLPPDDQVLITEGLRAENELLKSELESYKSRLKKVHDIFQSAQECM